MNNNLIIRNVITQLDSPTNEQQASSIQADNDLDAIKTWLLEFKHSPNTFISYRQSAERFILWLMHQHKTLKQVTRETIQDYQDFLADPQPKELWCGQSRPRDHRDWKPFVKELALSSIKLNIQILGSMFQYLIDAGYLERNPFRLIRQRMKPIQQIERFLSKHEWNYLLDYLDNLPRRNSKEIFEAERTCWIFNLLYLTGCRRSEVTNATMADFVNKRRQWWFKVIGKGNKAGEIPVTNELLGALIRYRRFLNLSSDYPQATETNIPIITAKYGQFKPISSSMLYKIIRNTCQKLAITIQDSDPASAYIIKQVSTHWLRHTSATHQVDAGIDIRVVKENLRHSLVETTMKYQHSEADSRYEETINKFGKNKI
jgi:site-specific recombinase XerD